MLKRIIHIFESIPATVTSGIFLILSFILSKTDFNSIPDPAWITVIISGVPILYSAIKKLIFNKGISKISSALLISTAMIAAIIIGDLFAAGEVAFIMALGEILENLTTDRAKKGIKKLANLVPQTARKLENGNETIINSERILIGDIIRILPGELIPADGIIVSGESSVDQSVLTGESLPIDKAIGDEVYCGTVNCFGSIDIKASKTGTESSLHKLILTVKEADSKKAPMARIADKTATLLVPVALLIAVLTGIITGDVVRSVTVLVVFCPCALVLATPTAIMAAIGQASKNGIIIKSGEALEKMGKVDTVAFDKTGALTHGILKVSDVITLCDDIDSERLLCLTASAESKSEHPLGKAIVSYAKEKGYNISDSESFKMESGRGISARLNGKNIICGNENFLNENNIDINANAKAEAEKLRNMGKALVFVAIENSLCGIIALSDTLKREAKTVISRLKEMNTASYLLSGDNKLTAEHLAEKIGIENVYAELLPEEKVERISSLISEKHTVCMIGDGINDAPALKTADIGIAMGSMGSDIAIDAADIALMSDDISKIPYLKRLSVATIKTIKFSIALSMLINIAAVVLSVLGLLGPTSGALVHNAGSFFVIFIASLLYDRRFN